MEYHFVLTLFNMTGNNWRAFVHFSRSERKGLFVLMILLLVSALYNYYIPLWVSNKQVMAFESELQRIIEQEVEKTDSIQLESKQKVEYNDTAAGSIPKSIQEVNKSDKVPLVNSQVQLSLNSFKAEELIKTDLVNKEIAYRIVKFRDKLGGFYHVDQLKEVFDYPVENHEKIVGTLKPSEVRVRSLSINRAPEEVLINHPYISKKLASQIVNFRTKYKLFETPDDVMKLYLVDEQLHNKLMPYLDLS